ncbi:hypothetical protein EV182_003410, partial [Spiromyces aspiralis]
LYNNGQDLVDDARQGRITTRGGEFDQEGEGGEEEEEEDDLDSNASSVITINEDGERPRMTIERGDSVAASELGTECRPASRRPSWWKQQLATMQNSSSDSTTITKSSLDITLPETNAPISRGGPPVGEGSVIAIHQPSRWRK